ncbi:CHAP domain-containing protein [Magnetospirillum sp. UT-4]|uniref:CHAP domain-containing protein n=1 Tax=Magnetospirillum sp. UT-4 TaxID=2681467 RepID=UPI001C2D5A12|nr:CHAP domain-containing protein [Magnetospirillum sp. UT-4]
MRKDSANSQAIFQVQERLNALGCGPIATDGNFGDETEAAVRLFQSRFADRAGQPLVIDGVVGAITWAALFEEAQPAALPPAVSPFRSKVLEIAASQVGVREQPPGSNGGPVVDQYLASVGLGTGYAWCAAFVHWCCAGAAQAVPSAVAPIRTGGVMDLWRIAGQTPGLTIISAAAATDDPQSVPPGAIFIINTGHGHGHTGFVEAVTDGRLATIEGNTNEGGSREGIGVFRRNARKVAGINEGFIVFP